MTAHPTSISTSEGQFTALIAGPVDGERVVLLHGFPQSRHSWRHQVPALGAAGYRVVAPDQRGYSPGVRPDPSTGLSAYRLDRLVADVLDIAVATSAADSDRRFHLVGHDWGGQVAWAVADRHPDLLRSLVVLSRPHPAAFGRALALDADGQRHRSRHHRVFDDPETATKLLEDGARRLRRMLLNEGVPQEGIADYMSVLGEHDALECALAWYRATAGMDSAVTRAIDVPTTLIWGDADATVGRTAAEGTAAFVRAPFRFEVINGAGHFLTDQEPALITELLLAHLRAYPITPA